MLVFRSTTAAWLIAAAAACVSPAVVAQPVNGPLARTLRDIFDVAWERQPDARAAAARRAAAEAGRAATQRLTAEPAALELQGKTGRSGSGGREYEAALTFPLWLPGERTRAASLADAQLAAVDLRVRAAQLKLAGTVRDAWWTLKRSEVELAAARDRVSSARQLAADVTRRVQAGDLARADQHQADSAVAQAEAAVAEADSARASAEGTLRGIVLAAPAPGAPAVPEPTPASSATPEHPVVAEAKSRALVARRTMELTSTQRSANPELTVGASRETGGAGEPSVQSLIVGIRVPFGGGPRQDARVTTAQAEALEAEAIADVEQNRVTSEAESARARLQASQAQVQAAERRARLAAETRGFYDKSFRLGESDLPTRLRVELEAAEAQRALARSRVEAAAAVSQLRQALGLLPE
ncbi:TolC family protein [Ramlibacter sp. RBP-2]|uniref:TolC family protein n=1 Tax=Ramlibacter lithotrophicus TaxID=2606681 RepID=A0A7X6DK49_9BURK|nr:TolC family protein [Ramlibacter lithotrophicus]NKE68657.1 TolC family protein [Ramlibacter lithotrophicus]